MKIDHIIAPVVEQLAAKGISVEMTIVGKTPDEIRIIYKEGDDFCITAMIEGKVDCVDFYGGKKFPTLEDIAAYAAKDIATCYQE
jgi:hypothetical protein